MTSPYCYTVFTQEAQGEQHVSRAALALILPSVSTQDVFSHSIEV